jgi:hypothetical protein
MLRCGNHQLELDYVFQFLVNKRTQLPVFSDSHCFLLDTFKLLIEDDLNFLHIRLDIVVKLLHEFCLLVSQKDVVIVSIDA